MKSGRKYAVKCLFIAFIAIANQALGQSTCTVIDTSLNLTLSENATNQWTIYKAPIEMALEAGTKGILDYSVPKQVRAWLGVMAPAFSVMAYHTDSSLDFFGRNDFINRRCSTDETAILEAQALESFAYAYLWSLQKFVPEWSDIVSEYAAQISVDLSLCSDLNTNECSPTNPIGLARILFLEVENVFNNDGWNADGSMTKTYNALEFEDWRKMNDQPNPDALCTSDWKANNEACSFWTFDFDDRVCWTAQELQINEKIYKEKYAFLHVHDSGRSYFLGDEEICNLDADYPCYNSMGEQADEVIRRLRESNDNNRAKVEFFNNVWNWMNLFVMEKYDNSDGFSQWQIIQSITATTASMYESTLVALKNKLQHGMIRPKSLIRKIRKGTEISAWLGPNLGVGQIDGSEWVPYLKDDPYPESPTLKGCLCAAFTTSMESFTGSPSIGFTIQVTREEGSSEIEVGEPSSDQDFSFSTWDQILTQCGESMLNSGNHFEKSFDIAESLCTSSASKVLKTFEDMEGGIIPDYVVDLDDLSFTKTRCDTRGDISFEITFGKTDGNE